MGLNGLIPLGVSNSSKLSVPYPGKRIDVLSIVGTHTLLIIRGAITSNTIGQRKLLASHLGPCAGHSARKLVRQRRARRIVREMQRGL